MKIGSLFSGMGGLDMAVESITGGRVVWVAETDLYASHVLAARFPDAPNLGDVRAISNPPAVDAICGGFPCQDVSLAGKGEGLSGSRSGLWSEFRRIVEDARPQLVFVENVAALRTRGLDQVLGELADLGFDAEWSGLQAAAVGAPHRRERMFVLAYADGECIRLLAERNKRESSKWRDSQPQHPRLDVADGDGDGRQGLGKAHDHSFGDARWDDADGRDSGLVYPPSPDDGEGWVRWIRQGGPPPGVRRSTYGDPKGLDARRRRSRLRLLGNGVAPRQAAAAFLALLMRAYDGLIAA